MQTRFSHCTYGVQIYRIVFEKTKNPFIFVCARSRGIPVSRPPFVLLPLRLINRILFHKFQYQKIHKYYEEIYG